MYQYLFSACFWKIFLDITTFFGNWNCCSIYYFILGNASFADLPEDILRQKYICEKHFEADDYRWHKGFYLKPNAVPKHYKAETTLTKNDGTWEVELNFKPTRLSIIEKQWIDYERKKRMSFSQVFPSVLYVVAQIFINMQLRGKRRIWFQKEKELKRENQDHLENLFSVVRQNGGWNLNPTARSFRLSFRIQFITNFLSPSKLSNCQESTD